MVLSSHHELYVHFYTNSHPSLFNDFVFLEKFKKTRLAYITVPDKNDLKYKYTASRYDQETDLRLAGVDILGLGPYTVSSF